jgi:DNA-binding XRE family transcriptional regulator
MSESSEEMIARVKAAFGPDWVETLLAAVQALPPEWKDRAAQAGFQSLRCRLRFTQDELAGKAGVAQSQISLIEGGGDALLSTWRRLYEAMGLELLLVPLSSASLDQLRRRAEQGRPEGHWRRQRARPRRRWKR